MPIQKLKVNFMRNVVVFICLFTGIFISFGQTEEEKVKETIAKSAIEGHIYFLADDLLKGRETGTPENKIAASYLANTLRSYGVKPNPKSGNYYQQFELKKISKPTAFYLSINGKEYKQKVAMQPANVDYTGDIYYLGYGLEDEYN